MVYRGGQRHCQPNLFRLGLFVWRKCGGHGAGIRCGAATGISRQNFGKLLLKSVLWDTFRGRIKPLGGVFYVWNHPLVFRLRRIFPSDDAQMQPSGGAGLPRSAAVSARTAGITGVLSGGLSSSGCAAKSAGQFLQPVPRLLTKRPTPRLSILPVLPVRCRRRTGSCRTGRRLPHGCRRF